MEKLLTISIAAYNVENYLSKTLESLIIPNKMASLEVLIINDGSKDKTAEVAQKYVEKWPMTFKLVNKQNGGYGSTINKAIEMAKGKYFKQLDGDDWFKTENFIKIMDILEKEDVDFIYTPYIKFYEKQEKEEIINSKILDCEEESNFDEAIKYCNKHIEMHSIIYRTEVLKKNKIRIDENCFYTDTEYAIYPLIFIKDIKIINIPLYVYRIGIEGQSISIESRKKRYNDHLRVSNNLLKFYNKNIDKFSIYLLEYVERLMISHLVATICNFLLIADINKNIFERINLFKKDVKKTNSELYNKMIKKSIVLKIMEFDNHYFTYIICHYIRMYKMKKKEYNERRK